MGVDGNRTMLQMSNFNMPEYDQLYSVFDENIQDILYTGKGAKVKEAPKDLFFMLVVTMKMGPSWNNIASMFRQRVAGLQKKNNSFVKLITPFIHFEFVENPGKNMQLCNIRKFKYFE